MTLHSHAARRTLRLSALVVVVFTLLLSPIAAAQITPEREYNLTGRAFPVQLELPAGSAQLHLLSPASAEVIARADVPANPSQDAGPLTVDLCAVFPRLWTSDGLQVAYLQLVVNDKKVGPALVLMPMTAPVYAPRLDRSGLPMFPGAPAGGSTTRPAAPPPAFSGIRALVDRDVIIETSRGSMRFALRPDAAPNTVVHFRSLVEKGFYTDILVHRIASLQGRILPDIVQTGDPTGTGLGGPGFFIDLENSTLPHDYGVLSMARGNDPNSAGSQFFICLSRDGTAPLDGRYAAFAQMVEGSETLMALAATPVNQDNRPIAPPRILSARLVDAPPRGEGPRPLTDPLARKPQR